MKSKKKVKKKTSRKKCIKKKISKVVQAAEELIKEAHLVLDNLQLDEVENVRSGEERETSSIGS